MPAKFVSRLVNVTKIQKAYSAVDELEITWALSITVTGSVFGTSQVGGVLGHSTIGIHLGEVEGTVQAARKLGNIDGEGELRSQKVEGLVLSCASWSHQICSGSDVGVCTLGDEVESERVAGGGDTVDVRVFSTVKSAVGGASCVVGAESGVPGVSSVAVGSSAGCLMEPSPVGIEDNGLGRSCATACGTFADGQRRMVLSSDDTNLLGLSRNKEGGEGEDTGQHDEDWSGGGGDGGGGVDVDVGGEEGI